MNAKVNDLFYELNMSEIHKAARDDFFKKLLNEAIMLNPGFIHGLIDDNIQDLRKERQDEAAERIEAVVGNYRAEFGVDVATERVVEFIVSDLQGWAAVNHCKIRGLEE